MGVPSTVTLVIFSLSVVLAQAANAPQPISRPDTVAGPWEVTGPSTVDGIHVMISGSQATQQSIQVRVYHRRPGRGSAGWYVLSPTPGNARASFDGTNLRLLGLTATFDPNGPHWMGEWVIDGQTWKVVLERPHAAKDSTPHPLCGDWEKVSDTAQAQGAPATSVVIHILQSEDGALTAWMDTQSVIIPQRYESKTFGGPMKIESAVSGNVILQSELGVYQNARDRFAGTLSADGNSLTGTWNGRRPESFRRVRER